MNKVIYKDEVYYYKAIPHKKYTSIDSKLFIYIKREGLISKIIPYKKIYGNSSLRRGEVTTHLEFELESILSTVVNKDVILIDCSKDIVDIYS